MYRWTASRHGVIIHFELTRSIVHMHVLQQQLPSTYWVIVIIIIFTKMRQIYIGALWFWYLVIFFVYVLNYLESDARCKNVDLFCFSYILWTNKTTDVTTEQDLNLHIAFQCKRIMCEIFYDIQQCHCHLPSLINRS